VVAILPNASYPAHHAVDRAGEPYRRTHDPARQRDFVVRLDEQVDVIGLHREVDDSKPRSRGEGHCAQEFAEDDLLA
jgi:hypothetical protein